MKRAYSCAVVLAVAWGVGSVAEGMGRRLMPARPAVEAPPAVEGGGSEAEGEIQAQEAQIRNLEASLASTQKQIERYRQLIITRPASAAAYQRTIDNLERNLESYNGTIAKARQRIADVRESVAANSERKGMTGKDLEGWLGDKEVVELVFTGPYMQQEALDKAVKTGGEGKGDFWRGNEAVHDTTLNFCRVSVLMKVSAESLETLRKLQEEAAGAKLVLDEEHVRAWSQKGDEKLRKEARELVGQAAEDFGAALRSEAAGSSTEVQTAKAPDLAVLTFSFGANNGGRLAVAEATVEKLRQVKEASGSVALPKLGLVITYTYRPGDGDAKSGTGRDLAGFLRAVEEGFIPLTKRERASP